MDCPKCKAKMSDLEEINLLSDKINEFGRRQLTWMATHKENVHWINDHYHCSKCDQDFSDKEGIMQ